MNEKWKNLCSSWLKKTAMGVPDKVSSSSKRARFSTAVQEAWMMNLTILPCFFPNAAYFSLGHSQTSCCLLCDVINAGWNMLIKHQCCTFIGCSVSVHMKCWIGSFKYFICLSALLCSVSGLL